MKTEELMLKVENVSKIYRLGEIGGTTLRDELQRLKAKVFKKEDPTKKIGSKNYNKGEKFKALDNISFEVKKGERIGIIGHNGAGKSTLLKLISRVTGPTEGEIHLNGRVASMLEVGTGFHPELTGRENIYMNGAILGMTKKEIDAKMEDIIEFSEVRQFIDTPVKRYSSGMYVKLAFSVAAHLDSEIMIMDEVLAVGDMNFQNKCLTKMKEVSEQDNKTILYVSHNMNTIRKLCDKVIVLDHGTIVFEGNVDEGIGIYMTSRFSNNSLSADLSNRERLKIFTQQINLTHIEFLDVETPVYKRKEIVKFGIDWISLANVKGVRMRFFIRNQLGNTIATSFLDSTFDIKNNEKHHTVINLNTSSLSGDMYYLSVTFFIKDDNGNVVFLDSVLDAISFKVVEDPSDEEYISSWNNDIWSNVHYQKAVLLEDQTE